MFKKALIFSTVFFITSLSFVHAASEKNKKNEQSKILTYLENDILYVEIELPKGTKAPRKCRKYELKNSKFCEFDVKIINGSFFSKSKKRTITGYRVVVEAKKNPFLHSTKLLIKTVAKVNETEFFATISHENTTTNFYECNGAVLDMRVDTKFSKSPENPRLARIAFGCLR